MRYPRTSYDDHNYFDPKDQPFKIQVCGVGAQLLSIDVFDRLPETRAKS